MKKNQYLNELTLAVSTLAVGAKGNDVKKVQEWLNIWRSYDKRWNRIVTIDSDFGHQTETAVKEFQALQGLPANGVIDIATFNCMVQPLRNAYAPITSTDLRTLVIEYATQHLNNKPVELKDNHGPWVRSYMDGNEGKDWAWCMGFVQTILDLSCSGVNLPLTQIMPLTYSCDKVGEYGLNHNKLIRNTVLLQSPGIIQPGDVFLLVKTSHDWTHTGIVTALEGSWIHTIEGNTNDEGSREGYEVCKRMRNLKNGNIDLFKIC